MGHYRIFRRLVAVIAACLLASCSAGVADADFRVIPLPSRIEQSGEGYFTPDSHTQIVFPDGSDRIHRSAELLADRFAQVCGLKLEVVPSSRATAPLRITLAADLPSVGEEGYVIEVSQSAVSLRSSGDEGVFRAVQTLCKSLPSAGGVRFAVGRIEDAPHYAYRGVMLDVARTFYPVEFLRKTIDMMALHQLNRLHLHLTDDQGWRLEIRKYPLLAQKGGFREENGRRVGGFYTREQMCELVAYAAERYVEIIPEIDMPGHLTAALAAYPELGCRGTGYSVSATSGVHKEVLCVGNDRAVAFMKNVLEEVISIFPSRFIHIGGDEVPRERWSQCPRCQHKIRTHGLKADASHSSEQRLQGLFNEEMRRFVSQHGRQVIGWDEMLESGVDPSVDIMAWRGVGKGFRALREGHHVVMSPCNRFYLDYYQSENVATEPKAVGGFINAETVYTTMFDTRELTAEQASRIRGVQGNLWTTFVPDPRHAEYMLLPRVTALSEMAWTKPGQRDYADFLKRMPRMQQQLEAMGWSVPSRFYTVEAHFEPNPGQGTVEVTLSTSVPADIYYTLDGTTPDSGSMHYEKSIALTDDTRLCAVACTPEGIRSDFLHKSVQFNKATLRPVSLLTAPHSRYGGNRLSDGVRATTIFSRGGWTGYFDRDMVAVVDLGTTMPVSRAGVSTLVDHGSHIMDLGQLEIEVSSDGRHFERVAHEEFPREEFIQEKLLPLHLLDFPTVEARYVRFTVCRQKELPPRVSVFGERQPFVFVDEVYVY